MNGEVVLTGAQLLYVVVGAIVAGGGIAAIGAGTLYAVVRSVLNNPGLVASLEAAAKNVDPDSALKLVNAGKTMSTLAVGLGAAGELVEEVFDKVPYSEKQK